MSQPKKKGHCAVLGEATPDDLDKLPIAERAREWTDKTRGDYERFCQISRETQNHLLQAVQQIRTGSDTVFAEDSLGEFVETSFDEISSEEFQRISKAIVRNGWIDFEPED